MIPAKVALPRGRSTVVSIEKSSGVKELNIPTQPFRQGLLQLLTEGRHLTDLTEPLEAAGNIKGLCPVVRWR